MAEIVEDQPKTIQESGEFTLPMYERVILAFLARKTTVRDGDEELLERLQDVQSKDIGNTLLHPEASLPSVMIGRMAERFLLDASNDEGVSLLRKSITEAEEKESAAKQNETRLAAVPIASNDYAVHSA